MADGDGQGSSDASNISEADEDGSGSSSEDDTQFIYKVPTMLSPVAYFSCLGRSKRHAVYMEKVWPAIPVVEIANMSMQNIWIRWP